MEHKPMLDSNTKEGHFRKYPKSRSFSFALYAALNIGARRSDWKYQFPDAVVYPNDLRVAARVEGAPTTAVSHHTSP